MENKKHFALFLFIYLFFINNLFSQIGINTERPVSVLDINGSTRITGSILVGGDDNTKGTIGDNKQLFISQGEGKAPIWQTVVGNNTETQGDWVWLSTSSKTDTKGGISLYFDHNRVTSAVPYSEEMTVYRDDNTTIPYEWRSSETQLIPNPGYGDPNTYWREFEDMSFSIPATNSYLRVFISIQLPVQAYWPINADIKANSSWISYAYGVFKDESPNVTSGAHSITLVGSTQGVVYGTGKDGENTPLNVQTLFCSFDVPASAKSTTYRILGVGRNTSVSVYNSREFARLYMGARLPEQPASESAIKHLTLRIDIFAKI